MEAVVTEPGGRSTGGASDDAAVFETAFDACYTPVARYVARRVSTDVVADVVSEVFLVAWRRRSQMPLEPLPWLYGVARKVVGNHRRGQRRRDQLVERLLAARLRPGAGAAGGADPTGGVETSLDLRAAFARLSDDDREVLSLVAWEGLTAPEVARALDCGLSAATMRIRRARARLEKLLQPHDIEGTKP